MPHEEIVHIRTVMDLADKLVAISEKGFTAFDDDECLMLNGIVRDCAFRLRDAAEHARRIYMTQGHWDSGREHHVP